MIPRVKVSVNGKEVEQEYTVYLSPDDYFSELEDSIGELIEEFHEEIIQQNQ